MKLVTQKNLIFYFSTNFMISLASNAFIKINGVTESITTTHQLWGKNEIKTCSCFTTNDFQGATL